MRLMVRQPGYLAFVKIVSAGHLKPPRDGARSLVWLTV